MMIRHLRSFKQAYSFWARALWGAERMVCYVMSATTMPAWVYSDAAAPGRNPMNMFWAASGKGTPLHV